MKTSPVIACVLLAAVALEVSAFRVDNNENLLESGKQWLRFRQGESSDGGSRTVDSERNPIDDSDFGFGEESSERQRYRSQNPISADRSSGLALKMAEKIAALQNIAIDDNIANGANGLLDSSALTVQKNSVKLSDREFVSFSNAVIRNLDDGVLEFMRIDPQKDAVRVEYGFDELETVGSFKSNVRNARSGRCTVVMRNVFSNVSTGFSETRAARSGPTTTFRYADVDVRTDDGTETQALDDAVARRYLTVLENAVTGAVLESTDRGTIARMKNEIRKPVLFRDAERMNKLFDMRWKEDDLAMEMSDVGLGNRPEQAVRQMLKSVSFRRETNGAYRMRYDFALTDLEWTSALTVEWTGKRLSAPSADFKIGKVDVRVVIARSDDRQMSCGCGAIDTDVTVSGLQYKLNENVQPELMTKIENELRRFIERSLESCVQESLKRELCNARKY